MTTPPAQQNQPSRFKAPSNLTTSERLSTNTVGLVALSDFRKRRAEVLEQQEREARDAFKSNTSGTNTPASNNNSNNNDDARSRSATPNVNDDGSGGERSGTPAEKKVKRRKKALVSFGDDEEEDGGEAPALAPKKNKKAGKSIKPSGGEDTADPAADSGDGGARAKKPGKITANASVGVVPRALTKAALRREAAEREKLRKEFLSLQEAVKNTEVAIPFVFYDGTNTPGGTVRVRKGEFVWVFLDKSRKLGADLGVGGEKNSNVRREWARVGVDDLMLVRGTVIIPHHYEFYFFIMNKTTGPGNVRLFNYSAEVPTPKARSPDGDADHPPPVSQFSSAKGGINQANVDVNSLEGVDDDPTFTKVVDRRWYERNKHIYPASVWQEFDPEKDYMTEVRKDTGGNTFFFSR